MRRLIPALGLLLAIPTVAQQHDPAMHQDHSPAATRPAGMVSDGRQLVQFPAPMKMHTLASMRDHLLALQEIQAALAGEEYDRAAEVAETRLGMTSLPAHGAHESSRYMPPGMQDAGSTMHRNASRFGTIAKDAGVTGDIKPAIAALSEVTGACVACHAGYRLQ